MANLTNSIMAINSIRYRKCRTGCSICEQADILTKRINLLDDIVNNFELQQL